VLAAGAVAAQLVLSRQDALPTVNLGLDPLQAEAEVARR